MGNNSNLWPCIGSDGLDIFSITADQRYKFGEDIFLRTHYPIAMRSYSSENMSIKISEVDILKKLLSTKRTLKGNRVFILYGAAGSGKSELMKWLQIMIKNNDKQRSSFTVRIPRYELNLYDIIGHFNPLLTKPFFSEGIKQRWLKIQKKPRTFTKMLLLTSLEKCLESDNQINASYYRLLDWVYPHVKRFLSRKISNKNMNVYKDEIITKEDLEEFMNETSLDIALDYEKFRHTMTTILSEQLMESTSIPDTLQRISKNLEGQGIRPILLIDDLVQSINLFATDILDYLITLDAGNWDTVIGLTPAALSTDQRGKELLDRITYLDTVDDRVDKIWLSDFQGEESNFLNEETCIDFAERYLTLYRELNDYVCVDCPLYKDCCEFSGNKEEKVLTPFNALLIQRIFNELPRQKGKCRYFIKALSEILEKIEEETNYLAVLENYISSKISVDTNNLTLRQVAELYGELVSDKKVFISRNIVSAFGLGNNSITLTAVSTMTNKVYNEYSPLIQTYEEPGKKAIKDWLEGKKVNRQSLTQFRRGVSRWIKYYSSIRSLFQDGIANPHKVLKWKKAFLGVQPPIIIEDIDKENGILVSREIGITAFCLYDFAVAKGEHRKRLLEVLSKDKRLISLLLNAVEYKNIIRRKLSKQLDIDLETLALSLYTWKLIVYRIPQQKPPGFSNTFWDETKTYKSKVPIWPKKPNNKYSNYIDDLFDDYFRVRKNLYNGFKIEQITKGKIVKDFIDIIQMIAPERMSKYIYIKNIQLKNFITNIQNSIHNWEPSNNKSEISYYSQSLINVLRTETSCVSISEIPFQALKELQKHRSDFYNKLEIKIRNE